MNPVGFLLAQLERGPVDELMNYYREHEFLTPLEILNSPTLGFKEIRLEDIRASLKAIKEETAAKDFAKFLRGVRLLINQTIVPKLKTIEFNTVEREMSTYISKNPAIPPKVALRDVINNMTGEKSRELDHECVDSFRKSFDLCLSRARVGTKINTYVVDPVATAVGLVGSAFGMGSAVYETTMSYLKVHDEEWASDVLKFSCNYLLSNDELNIREVREFFEKEEIYRHTKHIISDLGNWLSEIEALWDPWKHVRLDISLLGLQYQFEWCLQKSQTLKSPFTIQEFKQVEEKLEKKLRNTASSSHMFISCGDINHASKFAKLNVFERSSINLAYCVLNKTSPELGFYHTAGGKGTLRFRGTGVNLQRTLQEHYDSLQIYVKAIFVGNYPTNHADPQIEYVNNKFNRFYGPSSFSQPLLNLEQNQKRNEDGLSKSIGVRPYYYPRGWNRIGLRTLLDESEFDEKFGGWPIAYHGTAEPNAYKILQQGLETQEDGVHSRGEKAVYLSPSIEYAAHPRYSKVFKLDDGNFCQVVLQVRVNPNLIAMEKQSTIGLIPRKFNDDPFRIDPNFSNMELEWVIMPPGGWTQDYVRYSDGIVVYGLMVRITTHRPRSLPSSRWWFHDTDENNYPDPEM